MKVENRDAQGELIETVLMEDFRINIGFPQRFSSSRPASEPAADYLFITVWRIKAPIHDVCAAIQHAVHWRQSWKGVERVEALEPSDDSGVGSVLCCTWKSRPPYRLTFDVRVTRVEPLALVEAIANGELDVIGCWRCSHHESVTVVRYDRRVRTTRRWMNLLAPAARTLFRWNHNAPMRPGVRGVWRICSTRGCST